MRSAIFAVLALSCLAAHAGVYRCPQNYPGQDHPAAPLTGATMRTGEINGDGWLVGDDEAAEEGQDVHYGFADDEQAWLVCSYGGKKRIKGRLHDGHEWNQHVEGGGAEWWIKLGPKVGRCTIKLRESKDRDPGKGKWTADAVCEG